MYTYIYKYNIKPMREGVGEENIQNVHVSGDPSPVRKRHQESMLKGIQSYFCLVQTGHVGTGEKNAEWPWTWWKVNKNMCIGWFIANLQETPRVDKEEFPCGRKGERHTYMYKNVILLWTNMEILKGSGPDATKLFLWWANFFCSNLCSQPIKFEYFLIWEYSQT